MSISKTTPQKDAQRRANQRRMRAAKAAVNALKAGPCSDCGGRYPYWVMQFDHLNNKTAGIPTLMRQSTNLRRILAEVVKCEPVCGNCHADRTYQSSGGRGGHLAKPPTSNAPQWLADRVAQRIEVGAHLALAVHDGAAPMAAFVIYMEETRQMLHLGALVGTHTAATATADVVAE